MTQDSTSAARKAYYRTFNAFNYPVEPFDQLSLPEAQELATYYEATFNTQNQLIRFTKHLRQDEGDHSVWSVMFDEAYEYWASGAIKKRTVRASGQADKHWDFKEDARPWSRYLDDFCRRWFGQRETPELTLAEKAVLLHEQFTECELEVFEGSIVTRKDNQWAFETTSKLIQRLRGMLLEIEPNAIVTIVGGEPGDGVSPKLLKGFDEPALNLFGVVSLSSDLKGEVARNEVRLIYPDDEFDEMERNWAAATGIRTIAVAPIITVFESKLIVAFYVIITWSLKLAPDRAAVLASLVRRFVVAIQQIVELSRVWREAEMDAID